MKQIALALALLLAGCSTLAPRTTELNAQLSAVEGQLVSLTDRLAAEAARPVVDPGEIESIREELGDKLDTVGAIVGGIPAAIQGDVSGLSDFLGGPEGLLALAAAMAAGYMRRSATRKPLEDRVARLAAAVSGKDGGAA